MSGKMGGGGPPEQGVGESCLPECPSPLSLPEGEPIVPWLPVSGQEAEMTETVDNFVQEPQANLASARSPGTANQGTPRAGPGCRRGSPKSGNSCPSGP